MWLTPKLYKCYYMGDKHLNYGDDSFKCLWRFLHTLKGHWSATGFMESSSLCLLHFISDEVYLYFSKNLRWKSLNLSKKTFSNSTDGKMVILESKEIYSLRNRWQSLTQFRWIEPACTMPSAVCASPRSTCMYIKSSASAKRNILYSLRCEWLSSMNLCQVVFNLVWIIFWYEFWSSDSWSSERQTDSNEYEKYLKW